MKTKLLFVILFSAVAVCQAQFETGKKVIGGQIGLSFSKNDQNSSPGVDQRSSMFSSTLLLSRFKSPTLLKGFGFNYAHNYYHANIGNLTNDQVNRTNMMSVFVNSTKLQPVARKFYLSFTGSLGGSYTFGKSTFSNNTYTRTNGYGIFLSGGMGLLYQFNQRFLLSCQLVNLLNVSYGYGHFTTYNGANVNKSNISHIDLSTGLNGFSLNSILVGVRYILK